MFEIQVLMCYTESMLELLAPAGDRSAFEIAINSGADAVYLGLENFNARMKAQNFNTDNIGEVVSYAHFYGVKVYVTINTILQNEEFKDLITLVKVAIDAGVDAFLVQDLGVAKLLKECFDGIVLHASTQLGVHNLYGAKVAEDLGFKRVVLSRETKLEDIKAIRDNTNLEIEYFVQGALCVAFSGNCYLSSVEQGASGNRGLCKQLCRLPYHATLAGQGYDGYLLSAKDLCLFSSVNELAKAGVTSFKIEGRLRRDGYVASVVQTYRRAIDFANKGEQTLFLNTDEHTLKVAFSRGEYLKRAYLDEGVPKAIEKRFNNHTGVVIGKVLEVKEFKSGIYQVDIKTSHELKKGDGLKFFDNDKEVASLGAGDVKKIANNTYAITTTAKVKRGWQVNLILDSAVENSLLAKKRTVKISLDVFACAGKALQIVATCDDGGVSAISQSELPLDVAKNALMSANDIASACSKVGDSGFEVVECKVKTDGVFVARSQINACRREVLNSLKQKIVEHNMPSVVKVNEDKINEYLGMLGTGIDEKSEQVKVVRGEDFGGVYIKKGDRVLLKPNVYTAESVKRAIDFLDIDKECVMLDLPILANGKDVSLIEKLLSETDINTIASNNIYGLYFAQKGYRVVAGQGHNIANMFAENVLKDFGVSEYVPSCEYPDFIGSGELNRLEISESIPLMTFAHCPYKTLLDCDCSKCGYKPNLTITREKKKYAVRRVRVCGCRFELYPQK